MSRWGDFPRFFSCEATKWALSIARIQEPSVVLSDVIMPRLGGLSLLRRLKRWNPRIAVILFTAHPTLADAVSAMKAGAADVLTKPIDFKRLKRELETILDGVECPSHDSFLSRLDSDHSGSAARKPS